MYEFDPHPDAPFSLVSHIVMNEMCQMANDAPPGAIVEVGVYQGGTGYYLDQVAQTNGRPIYLFDTFTGIPYKGPLDRHRVGDFSDTSYEAVRDAIPNAQVIQGVFPESMPATMPPVAFVHLDCDQYQSIVDSVNALMPYLVDGAVIWFDDVLALAGATEAFKHLFGDEIPRAHCGKAYMVIEKEKG